MGAGNKKNKRPSVSPIKEQQLIERTPDNDYGVLSDPDELAATPIINDSASASVSASVSATEQPPQIQEPPLLPLNDDIHTEQLSSSNSQHQSPQLSPLSLQEQSPSLERLSPSLQPQIPESQISPSNNKSLAALQVKLTRDKNFSRKITLHTFFSYIILAMEMERASSASIARISPDKVHHLIEYMIEHHTETDAVRIYLQTILDTGVIKNLIESIIEFNKDQTEAFNKLLTTEQIELELASIQENSRHNTATTTHSPQTSQESTEGAEGAEGTGSGRIRKFFKRLFGFCCCCRNRHSFRHRTSQTQEPVILKDTEMTPPTQTEKPISQEPTNPQPQPQPQPLEQSNTDVVVENQTNN